MRVISEVLLAFRESFLLATKLNDVCERHLRDVLLLFRNVRLSTDPCVIGLYAFFLRIRDSSFCFLIAIFGGLHFLLVFVRAILPNILRGVFGQFFVPLSGLSSNPRSFPD